MPRPHIPHHLSLHRIKSTSSSHRSSGPDQSSPPSPAIGNSRSGSPNRSSPNMPSKTNPQASPGDGRGDHKGMGLVLRVTVVKGRNLAAKDKSGTSDPYLIVNLGDAKEATSVVSKTLNPEWNQTFEFPVTDTDSALLEAVCWDKDRFKKDYMGEFDVMLEEVFGGGNTAPEPKWFKIEGRRSGRRKQKKDANLGGEVLLKFQLFDPLNSAASQQQVLQKFYGVVSEVDQDDDDEDPDDLLSKMNSRELDDVSEEDDDDEEREPSDETDDGLRTPGGTPDDKQQRRRQRRLRKLKRKSKLKTYEFSGLSDVAGVLFLEINRIKDLPPERNMTRTGFDMDPFVVTSLGKKTYRTKTISHNLNPVFDEKLVFQVQKHELNYSLSFAVVDKDKFSGNDFVGTTLFPVDNVRSLAPEADPETGLYKLPDPDAVTDSDTRRRKWRKPMSRSTSQNNLSRMSNSSQTNLSKLTKSSSNSGLAQMSTSAPKPGMMQRQNSDSSLLQEPSRPERPAPTSQPSTASMAGMSSSALGLAEDGSDESGLYYYELPLELKNKGKWEDKHNPVLYIKAKYLPYRALRQQFWRVMLRQYDADESGKLDKVELVTMLDTLGSTLHNSTIDGFFSRFASENDGEEILTMDQAVMCLEEQLMSSTAVHKHVHTSHWPRSKQSNNGTTPVTSTAGLSTANANTAAANSSSSPDDSPRTGSTPYIGGRHGSNVSISSLNLRPSANQIPVLEVSDLSDAGERGERLPDDDLAVTSSTSLTNVNATNSGPPGLQRSDTSQTDDGGATDLDDPDPDEAKEEHVVEIHECPICHLPRLTRGRKTTDADIITHIATCASSDWRAVNNLMMAGFVTSSQAQRKWYSKIITKVSYGGYRLGANSANILVQDRMTGMINEERMSVYVRLGIRLLYKGLKSDRMEKKKVRKLLRSMSFKQGKKYDDPASAQQIPGFINFHQLDMSEVLRPTEAFKTFNEFFYRQLKPDARPCSAPTNPHIIVSPADCRSVVFDRLDEAQRIWVKGRDFSIERLLGDAYPQDAARYHNGSLGVFRLAPQDYHRFHVPVDGILGAPKVIEGEYYTVNPMAIRSALDVYGENVRVVVPIDSEVHGRVMVVCVGAMLVGSTVITRKEGERVGRAEELGYFKFGGSTLLVLFEGGRMRFDGDLVANSGQALETLIRVGMSIGHSPDQDPHTPDMQKANPTDQEKLEARRRIEGSLAPSSQVGGPQRQSTRGIDMGMRMQ